MPILPKPVWSSTQFYYQDTGYMPRREQKSLTIIVALRFPTSQELLPVCWTNRRCNLDYGVNVMSKHWLWHGGAYDPDSNTYGESFLCHIGPSGGGPGIWGFNVNKFRGGEVVTLGAVLQSDE
jgi:hypothetical protein